MENRNRRNFGSVSGSAVIRNSGLSSSMSRGQFLRTAGIAGGAVASAGLGWGGVAHAAASVPQSPEMPNPDPLNITKNDGTTPARSGYATGYFDAIAGSAISDGKTFYIDDDGPSITGPPPSGTRNQVKFEFNKTGIKVFRITAISGDQIHNNETFTIVDDGKGVSKTFEFLDFDTSTDPLHPTYKIIGRNKDATTIRTDAEMATAIASAITSVGLNVSASAALNFVNVNYKLCPSSPHINNDSVGNGFAAVDTAFFCITPGNTQILISSTDSSSQVASKIVSAINSITIALLVTAQTIGNRVFMMHDTPGSAGNKATYQDLAGNEWFFSGGQYPADSEIWVYPTDNGDIAGSHPLAGQYAIPGTALLTYDCLNVQWAVSNVQFDGTVRLKKFDKNTATLKPFNFGNIPGNSGTYGVRIAKNKTVCCQDINIIGETDSVQYDYVTNPDGTQALNADGTPATHYFPNGIPRTEIKGGIYPFIANPPQPTSSPTLNCGATPARGTPNAPPVVTIKNIFFNEAVGNAAGTTGGVLIQYTNGHTIDNCKVKNTNNNPNLDGCTGILYRNVNPANNAIISLLDSCEPCIFSNNEVIGKNMSVGIGSGHFCSLNPPAIYVHNNTVNLTQAPGSPGKSASTGAIVLHGNAQDGIVVKNKIIGYGYYGIKLFSGGSYSGFFTPTGTSVSENDSSGFTALIAQVTINSAGYNNHVGPATIDGVDYLGNIFGNSIQYGVICNGNDNILDGNTFGNAGIAQVYLPQPSRAIEYITAVAVGDVSKPNIRDGDKFTISDDGIRTLTFEFDNNGIYTNVPIPISGSDSAATVASSIAAAINRQFALGNILITASSSGASCTLSYAIPGLQGNHALIYNGDPNGANKIAATGFLIYNINFTSASNPAHLFAGGKSDNNIFSGNSFGATNQYGVICQGNTNQFIQNIFGQAINNDVPCVWVSPYIDPITGVIYSGVGNRFTGNNFSFTGLTGWQTDMTNKLSGVGCVLLDEKTSLNYVNETLFPIGTTACTQVLDLTLYNANPKIVGANQIVGCQLGLLFQLAQKMRQAQDWQQLKAQIDAMHSIQEDMPPPYGQIEGWPHNLDLEAMGYSQDESGNWFDADGNPVQ